MRTKHLLAFGILLSSGLLGAACGGGSSADSGDDTFEPVAGSGGAKAAGAGGHATAGTTSGGATAAGSGGASTAGKGGSAGASGAKAGGASGGSAGASGAKSGGAAGSSITCAPLTGDCNDDPSDGCETSTAADAAHCGTCSNVCPSPLNSQGTCSDGKCSITCETGFGDCDGNATNGCEANLKTDPKHCGSCTATACPDATDGTGVAACIASACALSCSVGHGNCSATDHTTCETDTLTDGNNCGSCGNACGAGVDCTGGSCACAASKQAATRLPVDIYIMLDRSGSMTETTGKNGPSKWDAVKAALEAFDADMTQQGVSIGVQYFPAQPQGLPDNCQSNPSACGTHGPCVSPKVCSIPDQGYAICDVDADCEALDLGTCQPPFTGTCSITGDLCSSNGDCAFKQDKCNGPPVQICVNADCAVGDYSAPDVEIAALPGAGTGIATSLDAHTPTDGGTPTYPALLGATQHATSWQMANPNHVVAVLLATDGLPSECTPDDIPSIAKIASDELATSNIHTFVVGVFAPAEATTSKPNLDQIATAGGSTTGAIIVDTSGDVTTQFEAALNAIRGQSLGCEFVIPAPTGGGSVDPNKLNVDYTPTGQSTQTLVNVTDQTACTATGWYYDNPTTPTKVELCPTVCTAVKGDPTAQIDIAVGCATIKPLSLCKRRSKRANDAMVVRCARCCPALLRSPSSRSSPLVRPTAATAA